MAEEPVRLAPRRTAEAVGRLGKLRHRARGRFALLETTRGHLIRAVENRVVVLRQLGIPDGRAKSKNNFRKSAPGAVFRAASAGATGDCNLRKNSPPPRRTRNQGLPDARGRQRRTARRRPQSAVRCGMLRRSTQAHHARDAIQTAACVENRHQAPANAGPGSPVDFRPQSPMIPAIRFSGGGRRKPSGPQGPFFVRLDEHLSKHAGTAPVVLFDWSTAIICWANGAMSRRPTPQDLPGGRPSTRGQAGKPHPDRPSEHRLKVAEGRRWPAILFLRLAFTHPFSLITIMPVGNQLSYPRLRMRSLDDLEKAKPLIQKSIEKN